MVKKIANSLVLFLGLSLIHTCLLSTQKTYECKTTAQCALQYQGKILTTHQKTNLLACDWFQDTLLNTIDEIGLEDPHECLNLDLLFADIRALQDGSFDCIALFDEHLLDLISLPTNKNILKNPTKLAGLIRCAHYMCSPLYRELLIYAVADAKKRLPQAWSHWVYQGDFTPEARRLIKTILLDKNDPRHEATYAVFGSFWKTNIDIEQPDYDVDIITDLRRTYNGIHKDYNLYNQPNQTPELAFKLHLIAEEKENIQELQQKFDTLAATMRRRASIMTTFIAYLPAGGILTTTLPIVGSYVGYKIVKNISTTRPTTGRALLGSLQSTVQDLILASSTTHAENLPNMSWLQKSTAIGKTLYNVVATHYPWEKKALMWSSLGIGTIIGTASVHWYNDIMQQIQTLQQNNQSIPPHLQPFAQAIQPNLHRPLTWGESFTVGALVTGIYAVPMFLGCTLVRALQRNYPATQKKFLMSSISLGAVGYWAATQLERNELDKHKNIYQKWIRDLKSEYKKL